MNLKSLTENRYTLNDIFVKNSEGWLITALLLFPLAHIIHILIFTFTNKDTFDLNSLTAVVLMGEYPGDHFVTIIYTVFPFIVAIGVAGLISKIIQLKKSNTNIASDLVPLTFLLVFAVLIVISSVVNKTPQHLIWGITSATGEAVLTILIYILIFIFGSFVRSEKNKYIVIYAIMGVGLVSAFMTVFDQIIDVPIVSYNLFASIYYNTNFYAYFLTILIMLSAALVLKEKSKGRRIFAFFMLCINSYVLAINNTFGCFVACFLAFIIMIIADSVIRKKFSFAALGTFVVFLAICFVTSLWFESFFTQIIGLFTDLKMILLNDENADEAGTLRWGLWRNIVVIIKKRPWVGYGYEGAAKYLLQETDQGKPHNEYLEYAADFGVPAAISYIAGLIAVYIKAFVKRQKIDGATFCALVAAFGYIGSAFFGCSKVYVAPIFFMLMGFANGISDKGNEEQNKNTEQFINNNTDNPSSVDECVECNAEE